MRSVLFVLATGAVSWTWSEAGFWARFRPGDSVAGSVAAWLLYSAVAYLVLRVARRRPPRGPAGVMLLGALYGWLVEGVAAATLYQDLPLSLIWTGVAWHALLTVVVGWYALPRALRGGGPVAAGWCALAGLAWGLWAIGWWGAPPDTGMRAATPAPMSFAVFAVMVGVVAALGYGVQHATGPHDTDLTGRAAPWTVGGLLAAWAIPEVLIPIPWAPIVLAAVVTIALVSLRRLDHASPGGGPVALSAGVPWSRLAPLIALPSTAILVYLVAAPAAGSRSAVTLLHAGFVGAIIALCLAGVVALGGSLRAAWRHRDIEAAAPPAERPGA